MSLLTGHTRVREQKRWFRRSLMVLQVEETRERVNHPVYDLTMEQFKAWRDARMEDIIVLDSRDRTKRSDLT